MIREERLPSLCGGTVQLSVYMTSKSIGDPQPLKASSAATPNCDRDFLCMPMLSLNT